MAATLVYDHKTMSTGVKALDDEHKTLIANLNILVTAMEQGQGAEVCRQALAKVKTYTVNHFAHEEKCMVQFQCPVGQLNVDAHKLFVKSVLDFEAVLNSKGPSQLLAAQLSGQIMGWLRTHILTTDTKLRACVPVGTIG